MKLSAVLTVTLIGFLSACSSAPSPYPQIGIAAPTQGIASPRQSNIPFEIEEEFLPDPAQLENPGRPATGSVETIPTTIPE